MASRKIECLGRFREHDLRERRLSVKMPLANGRMVEAEVRVHEAPGKPSSALIRLQKVVMEADGIEARDGILKPEMSGREEDIGVFSELCPLPHVLPLLQELLREHRIETDCHVLEVGKRLGAIPIDETMLPRRNWTVDPAMGAEGTGDLGKYLLMKRRGLEEYVLGWDASKNPQHRDIWRGHDDTENLGGGFIFVVRGLFQMNGDSSNYSQPTFNLVYDAALGLVKALRPDLIISKVEIEGAERYRLQSAGQ